MRNLTLAFSWVLISGCSKDGGDGGGGGTSDGTDTTATATSTSSGGATSTSAGSASGGGSGGAGGSGGSTDGQTGGGSGGGSGGSSGGGSGGGSTCQRAEDCKLFSDCCTCQAVLNSENPPECDLACDQTACERWGAQDATCGDGQCVITPVNCDDSMVTCDGPTPDCDDDFRPVVTMDGSCWTGQCAPTELCG